MDRSQQGMVEGRRRRGRWQGRNQPVFPPDHQVLQDAEPSRGRGRGPNARRKTEDAQQRGPLGSVPPRSALRTALPKRLGDGYRRGGFHPGRRSHRKPAVAGLRGALGHSEGGHGRRRRLRDGHGLQRDPRSEIAGHEAVGLHTPLVPRLQAPPVGHVRHPHAQRLLAAGDPPGSHRKGQDAEDHPPRDDQGRGRTCLRRCPGDSHPRQPPVRGHAVTPVRGGPQEVPAL
mmetsp:Transcript_10570/g.25444  ORF Transcript_10570/g.25444 Transcript_10570/m.25444 type:complete len:230 (-) Transcript_10570:31-720(-)